MHKALFSSRFQRVLTLFFSICWIHTCLFLQKAQSQESPGNQFSKILKIPRAASQVVMDPLKNLYLVSEQNEIFKLSIHGAEQFRYSTTQDGHLNLLDVSNPMYLLGWFSDFNSLKIFDRTLQPLQSRLLLDYGIFSVSAVALALDRNIWVFDDLNVQLKKIDLNSRTLLQSNRLDLLLNHPVRPVFMREYENRLYMADPECGILILDVFGRFLTLLPFRGITEFQILDNQLQYLQNQTIHSYHLQALVEQSFNLPEDLHQNCPLRLQGKFLLILKNDGVEVWEWTP